MTTNAAADDATERANPWLGTLITVFSAITFGLSTTFARLAYEGGSNPLSMVLIRVVIFVIVVGAAIAFLRRPVRLSRHAFLTTLWMAAALTMLSLGYLGSVAFIPVSLAALIFLHLSNDRRHHSRRRPGGNG